MYAQVGEDETLVGLAKQRINRKFWWGTSWKCLILKTEEKTTVACPLQLDLADGQILCNRYLHICTFNAILLI
jgi:hypothetical protein